MSVTGPLHGSVTGCVSDSEYYLGVHHGLKFNGRQTTQAGLSASAMIGALNPGDDREAQLVSGDPRLAIEYVVLQQREERFHRSIIACGPDSAHGAD